MTSAQAAPAVTPPALAPDTDASQLDQVSHSADELRLEAGKARSDAALAGLRQSAAATQAKAEALATRHAREVARDRRAP